MAKDVKKRLTEEGPIIIAWKHERLPALAKELGMEKPGTWKADDFDRCVLSFEGGKPVSSKEEAEGHAE